MGMLSRAVKVAVPVGAGLVAYSCREDIANDGLTAPFRKLNAFVSKASASYTNFSSAFDRAFPRGTWDANWDFRDPTSLINAKKFAEASPEDRKKMLKEVTPTASRTLVLIRHGQYDLENEPHPLTELGREQAVLVGKRLAALHEKMPIDNVIMSTMTRATETATIILKQLPSSIPSRSDSIIEEGAPYPPEPPVGHWRPHAKKFFSEGARIEAAFRKYFYRASFKQSADSVEVLVCHANVIRYFICRAMQFPPEGWLRMSLGNSSITVLVIRPDGRVSIRSVGDVGHLPPAKITFT